MYNNTNDQSAGSPSGPQSNGEGKPQSNMVEVPSISLPKGGGAIKRIDEKFAANPANGIAVFSISFPFSPSRNSFVPGIGLSYNSGSGNGPFGLGWNAQPGSIVRKTEKKLPQYKDGEEPDIFIFSGAEDLVPAYIRDESGNWTRDSLLEAGVSITRYKPRLEGGFARIEKITELTGNVFWKITSSAYVVTIYGKSKAAQVCNPVAPDQIFQWFLEFSYDDKGNCYQLEYKKEDKVNVTAHRFANTFDLRSLLSNAAKTEEAAQEGAEILSNPDTFDIVSNLHVRGTVISSSPLVSIFRNLESFLTNGDKVAKAISGIGPAYGGYARAPFILTFEVPENLIMAPQNELSVAETELLFFGRNLLDYLVSAKPNPYH